LIGTNKKTASRRLPRAGLTAPVQGSGAASGAQARAALGKRFHFADIVCFMNGDSYLAFQTLIICVLLFLVGTTAVVEHPEWFQ